MKCFAAIFLSISFAASAALAAAKVQTVDAGNGATALLVEDHTLPIITIKIAFDGAGTAYDPQGKEGLSNFVAQMLDEGAGEMDSLAFNRALEDHAIRFSANTSEDSMTVGMQTMSEFKTDALHLFALALQKPRFDTEAVERIRASIETDLNQLEEKPGYLASRKWKEVAFAGHPYQHLRRGTPSSVAAIGQKDLQDFVYRHFSCDARAIAVVGDITLSETREWLRTLFSKEKCTSKARSIPDISLPDGGAPIRVDVPVPQTVVEASLPAVSRKDPEYYATYVMVHILGGDTIGSRLGKEIRDKRGLAYYAEAQLEELDHVAAISVYFATRSTEALSAVNLFLEELKKMSERGVTQAELEDAKNSITGSFPLGLDNENALAEYLILMQHFGLGNDYLDKRNSLMESVTLAEVNHMAKQLLSHRPLIVMSGQNSIAGAP